MITISIKETCQSDWGFNPGVNKEEDKVCLLLRECHAVFLEIFNSLSRGKNAVVTRALQHIWIRDK